VELEKGIDPHLKNRRDALERDHLAAGNRIVEEHRKPAQDEALLASSKAEMERLAEELDRVKKQIRLTNPLYASVQYPEPIAVAELQRRVLAADETLLEYFLTAKGVFCFVVTRERFETVKLALSEEALRSRVEALLDNLESGPARGEGYDRAAAGDLYDILLKPVEKSLPGRALIVVPDGILARLPFEALVVAKDGGRDLPARGKPGEIRAVGLGPRDLEDLIASRRISRICRLRRSRLRF
jgi:CHAT domain-containing protein